MNSHPPHPAHPPPAPRFSMPMRHPTLPPVQAAVGMPPLQAATAPSAHHLPHPALHGPVHAHSAAHLGAHLPHPVLPGLPGLPGALPAGLVPVAAVAGHGYYGAYGAGGGGGGGGGVGVGGAAERLAALEADNAALRRENDSLRAKLADLDRERAKAEAPKVQSRYWTPDEHQRFLEALSEFGPKDVRAIASYVGTRNATQVRTHAQKYFLRKEREQRSALHAARKRSMSESDLARMGARAAAGAGAGPPASATPPGSPLKREAPPRRLRGDARAQDLRGDTRMADVPAPAAPAAPALRRAGAPSGLASPLSTSVISIPAMISQTSAPPPPPVPHMPGASAARPPPDAGKGKPPLAKVADSSGINLLSLVASEHEMQTVRSKN